jgi:hypothetical protein
LEAIQLSLDGLSFPIFSSMSLANLNHQQGKQVSSIFQPDFRAESMLSDGLRYALPEYHRSDGD